MLRKKFVKDPRTILWEIYVHSIVVKIVVTKNVPAKAPMKIFFICLGLKMWDNSYFYKVILFADLL